MSDPARPDPALLDPDQLRRRAKELLRAARAGDPAARTRLAAHTGDRPARLSDAQHAVAVAAGYRGWTDLVRDHRRFTPATADTVPWSLITRVTVVCFRDDGDLVLHRDQDRWCLSSDARRPGEDCWDEAVFRIPLQQLGFRRQGTHVLALDERRRHVVFWIDGDAYEGSRPPTPAVRPEWWTGDPAEGATLLAAQGDGAAARLVTMAEQARATLTPDRHDADLRRTLVGSYLRGDTPEAGSGFGGTPAQWRERRGSLLDAIPRRTGVISLVDLCCANGHLPVSLAHWAAEAGLEVDPYGVDVAPELIDRARTLHPGSTDRFWVGDARRWVHPEGRRFDVAYVLLDVIPDADHHGLLAHLLEHVVADAGRLVVGNYAAATSPRSAESLVSRAGYAIAGRTTRPTRDGRPSSHPAVWIDAASPR